MADSSPYPDPAGDPVGKGAAPGRESSAGMPRWVKVLGIIAVLLLLLVGVAMLTGVGGSHGPGRHTSSGGDAGRAPPSAIGGHKPPKGGHAP